MSYFTLTQSAFQGTARNRSGEDLCLKHYPREESYMIM